MVAKAAVHTQPLKGIGFLLFRGTACRNAPLPTCSVAVSGSGDGPASLRLNMPGKDLGSSRRRIVGTKPRCCDSQAAAAGRPPGGSGVLPPAFHPRHRGLLSAWRSPMETVSGAQLLQAAAHALLVHSSIPCLQRVEGEWALERWGGAQHWGAGTERCPAVPICTIS